MGNVAHGAGAVLGGLTGFALAGRGRRRGWAAAGLVAALAVSTAAAWPGRPYVNFSHAMGAELAHDAYDDLQSEQNERAVRLLREAVARPPADADWWFNLGIAYERLKNFPQSLNAFSRAAKLNPASQEFRDAVRHMQARMTRSPD